MPFAYAEGQPVLSDVTLASLRCQIGLVGQDVFLFGGALRGNIACGRLDATEAAILAAADKAQLGPRWRPCRPGAPHR